MSRLVTSLTPEELSDLQAEMQSPANVDRLPKKFPEAMPPCFYVHPRMKEGEENPWASLWSYAGGDYEVVLAEGEKVGPVYNRDSTRGHQAKDSQPEPGEKPLLVAATAQILRLTDGSLAWNIKL